MIINWGATLSGNVKTSAISLQGNTKTSSFTLNGTFICGAGQQRYEDSYIVTPTRYTQTLPTSNKLLTSDVIVNPIPPEYGLITWDGVVLTVS